MTEAPVRKDPQVTVSDPSPPDAFRNLFVSRPAPPAGPSQDAGVEQAARGSIAEEVAGRLLALIKSGNLKSGDKLPTEQQMTLALGISRPPLREALKALTLMGVLESRQGGRYTVTDLSPSRLVAPFNIMLSGRDYDAALHYEARAAVDLELVRLCCRRADEPTRHRLVHLASDGAAFLDDPVGFRVLDFEFHQTINAGARNLYLQAVAQGLYDVALELRRIATLLPGVLAQSCADHVRIADAILRHDEAGAVAAYRGHLDNIRDTTIRSLAELDLSADAPAPPVPF